MDGCIDGWHGRKRWVYDLFVQIRAIKAHDSNHLELAPQKGVCTVCLSIEAMQSLRPRDGKQPAVDAARLSGGMIKRA